MSIVLLLANCSSYNSKKQIFHQQFNAGQYASAARSVLPSQPEDCQKDSFYDEGFLFSLNSGTAFLFSQEYNLSSKMYEISDSFLIEDETDGYTVKYYDKIMLSTYKALAYMQQGDIDNARLEFNRAYARQAEAAEQNKKQINKAQEELQEQNAQQSFASAQAVIAKEYREFDNFKAYADFTNPYTTYLSGLFLTTSQGTSKSDIENGVNYLKRVKGMAPDNKFVKADIRLAEGIANGKKPGAMVWVIYESGLVSDVEKVTYTVPFYLASGVKVAQMSLPKLVPLAEAYPNLLVSNGKDYIATEPLTDMDRVIKTEFKQRFPAEVSKAVVWMTVNLIAQEAAQQAIGKDQQLYGALAAAAISQASNPVDTRTWTSLPKTVQIARIQMPKNRTVKLFTNDGQELTEDIVFDKNVSYALIHVRIPMVGAIPSVAVTKFK